MALPPSYSGNPREEQSHYYRRILLEFKHLIQSSKEPEALLEKMDQFINASHEVQWPHKTSSVFRKDPYEKAVQKVVSEFKRYVTDLQNLTEADPQYLLDALIELEPLADDLKLR